MTPHWEAQADGQVSAKKNLIGGWGRDYKWPVHKEHFTISDQCWNILLISWSNSVDPDQTAP